MRQDVTFHSQGVRCSGWLFTPEIAAEHDSAVPLAIVQAAYERIPEPKSLVVLPCGHFDVYQGHWAEKAADLATEWFTKHLWSA